MSITLRKLYKNGNAQYKMTLIAGEQGLDNFVKWVHIIEDVSTCSFLEDSEMVFTSGYICNSEKWLLNFVKCIQGAGASGLAISMGLYITDISSEVKAFCNSHSFPLFTISKETKMIDVTRDFCYRIVNAEHVQNSLSTTFKNIIFKVGDTETQVVQMERYGYQRNSNYTFASLMTCSLDNVEFKMNKEKIENIAKRLAKLQNKLFISFYYVEYLVFCFIDFSKEEIERFITSFINEMNYGLKNLKIHIGISPSKPDICEQNINLEKSFSALKMAQKLGQTVVYYDKLGIHKLLFEVGDKAVLHAFYQDSIGLIESYDVKNNTGLSGLLKTYLENNGCIQTTAELNFVHRNTVINQLKKIAAVTGLDPTLTESKVKLSLGFYIKEMLA